MSFSLSLFNLTHIIVVLLTLLTLVLLNPDIPPAFANSEDPDQSASSDMDLHCLPLSM